MGKILKYLLLSASLGLTAFGKDKCIEKPANVWYKITDDALNPGQLVTLDMSRGYSYADDFHIFIIVQIMDTEEVMYLAFPNGGPWKATEPDPFLLELQEEFESLEDYLRNKGTEIEKR